MLKDPLRQSLGYQLRRAAFATMGDLARAFGPLGLKLVEAVTLRLIDANPGCNQGEIGRELGVQRTNMVPIISNLVARGFVRREIANGRTHALHLTAEGQDLQARVTEAGEAYEQEFLADISDMERQVVLEFCLKMRGLSIASQDQDATSL